MAYSFDSRFLIAACAIAFSAAVSAQTPATRAKPERQLPPTPAAQTRIPAGVDSGSPGSSDTLPLGTPVPPSNAADRGDLRMRSAAARAATRKGGAASAAAGSDASAADKLGCAQKVAPDGRPAGGQPVALPGSGFTGQSASPEAAAATGKRPTGRVC